MEWKDTMKSNGEFKTREELLELCGTHGVNAEQDIVTYCHLGIRAAHLAFVLEDILGFKNVRVYEGSMKEYGDK